ncbi:MAG: SDR family NAD(P)-dependent oxidoreductase [Candidatus Helarchaeota archaeon]
MRLKDRVAIITAAAGAGIGKATASKLAEEGAKVAITDINERRINETVDELKKKFRDDQIIGVLLDVTDSKSVNDGIRKVFDNWGRIDILVNNAGRNVLSKIEKMTDEQWDLVINVNLKGTFYCSRAVIPYMKEQKYGKIISISSAEGWIGSPMGEAQYAASKAGVMGFTRALARELAPDINVNAIAPGIVPNPFLARIYGDMLNEIPKMVPMQRGAKPSEIADAVAFLASDEASYIIGVTLTVSGGMYMNA